MGIGPDLIGHLTDLKRNGRLRRAERVIEIGAQQLAAAFLEPDSGLEELFATFGRPLWTPPAAVERQEVVHGGVLHQAADAPPARPFWMALGFEYAAIDVDESPGAIALDLNFDAVPAEARGRYDVVTNFGTTEHVCNQLNAFRVIHDLTAPDALMIHNLPMQGYLSHGIVNYNPKFFIRLAQSNGYEVVYFDIVRAGCPEQVQGQIAAMIRGVGGNPAGLSDYMLDDAAIRVTLRKVFDQEFVPPLDVPPGAGTSDQVVRQRYWPVFQPEAVQAMLESRHASAAAAHGAGDYVAARILWEPLAMRGHLAAQANLGMMHLLGQGGAMDIEAAVHWLTRAAEQGLNDARVLLAQLLAEGAGVPKDLARAAWWLQQAARSGHAAAQNGLAMAYFTGAGVARDLSEAAAWFRRAAEQGHLDAQINLAVLHLRAEAGQRDVAAAAHWLQQAEQNPRGGANAAQLATLRRELAAAA